MSQEVPILFRVKTDVQTAAVHYWSVWVMKSSDWCGAAGLSVRGNREWHDWPTDGLLSEKLRSSTSSANVSDEKGVSSSHPVSFFVWTWNAARCPLCPHRASVDVYSGQISQVMTSSGSRSFAVSKHTFHVWSDFLSFGVCQWDFASVNQENVPHFLFVQRTPRESCEASRRVQAGRTTTEEEVRILGSHRNVTEIGFDLFICALRSAVTCAQVHASSLIR